MTSDQIGAINAMMQTIYYVIDSEVAPSPDDIAMIQGDATSGRPPLLVLHPDGLEKAKSAFAEIGFNLVPLPKASGQGAEKTLDNTEVT